MSSGYEGVDLFSDLSYHAPRLNLGSPGTGSEGSLTQEGYETILFNGLGPDLYAASGSDTNGESGLMESNVDFWFVYFRFPLSLLVCLADAYNVVVQENTRCFV